MIYVTGDLHGHIRRIKRFSLACKTSVDDVLIILGDAGLNYSLTSLDAQLKAELHKLNLTILAVHGNHEARPESLASYVCKEFKGGAVYLEENYPRLLFAKDGSVFNLDGYKTLVIGGAYSVNKERIIAEGGNWFADEQPSAEIKAYVESQIAAHNFKLDVVLSHTCPFSVRPQEFFLPQIKQEEVDCSTEVWLQTIADKLEFKRWYYGHYHNEKRHGPYRLLFKSVELFMDETGESVVYPVQEKT